MVDAMGLDVTRDKWQDDFAVALLRIFEDALDIKTRMAASTSEFEFFWPAPGHIMDCETMKCEYPSNPLFKEQPTIAFTKRPGLYHTFRTGQIVRKEIKCVAVIVKADG